MDNALLVPVATIAIIGGIIVTYQASSDPGAMKEKIANLITSLIVLGFAVWLTTVLKLTFPPLFQFVFWAGVVYSSYLLYKMIIASVNVKRNRATGRSIGLRMIATAIGSAVIVLIAWLVADAWGIWIVQTKIVVMTALPGIAILEAWAGLIYVMGHSPSSEES